MTWVKLDDQFPDHPKVVEAGETAAWAYVKAVCYCARFLTDGQLTTAQARRLGDEDSIRCLVQVGLWEERPGGYSVHDYHDYQPSAAQVKAERDAARLRMQRGRSSGEQLANSAANSAEVQPPRTRSRIDVDEESVETPPVSPPAAADGAAPTAPAKREKRSKRERRPMTDDQVEALYAEFEPQFGSEERVRGSIERAMNHTARLKAIDEQLYLRNWLRRDLDELRQQGKAPRFPGPVQLPPETDVAETEPPACAGCGHIAPIVLDGQCADCLRSSAAVDAWSAVLGELRSRTQLDQFATYLDGSRGVCFDQDGELLVVESASEYFLPWLNGRLSPLVASAAAEALGHSVQVQWCAAQPGAAPNGKAASQFVEVAPGIHLPLSHTAVQPAEVAT